jgi:hypothetical protein
MMAQQARRVRQVQTVRQETPELLEPRVRQAQLDLPELLVQLEQTLFGITLESTTAE